MTDIFNRQLPWTQADLNEINCGGRTCECDGCNALAIQMLRTRADMHTPPHVFGMVKRYYCQDHFDVALEEETRRYP